MQIMMTGECAKSNILYTTRRCGLVAIGNLEPKTFTQELNFLKHVLFGEFGEIVICDQTTKQALTHTRNMLINQSRSVRFTSEIFFSQFYKAASLVNIKLFSKNIC